MGWVANVTGLLALVILSACEEKPYAPMVKSPDGSEWWYDITCSGGRGDCMNTASAVCKHGYEIVGINEGVSESSRATGARVGNVVSSRSRSSREDEMFVRCRHKSADSP
jgi:hypothetical protein